MRYPVLIFRSLVHYFRNHLGVFLGSILSTTILVGALVVGDSVRYSLHKITLERLGKTEYIIQVQERYFRAELAEELSVDLGTEVVPILRQVGSVSFLQEQLSVSGVQMLGVDKRFWQLGSANTDFSSLKRGEVIINQRLATRLNLKQGDDITLRVPEIEQMPYEAPLAAGKVETNVMHLKVRAVATQNELANFNLNINQQPPLNVFILLPQLAENSNLSNQANLLLVAETRHKKLSIEAIERSLRKNWQLDDIGLILNYLEQKNIYELKARQVFIDHQVYMATVNSDLQARGIFTYFVNSIEKAERATPYSFITAPGPPIIPTDLKDDEIIIINWLAEDLEIGKDEEILIKYFTLDQDDSLVEKSTSFIVKEILPLTEINRDLSLVPDLPGISQVDNCRDWESGVPIDLNRIRPKDEDYWNKYKSWPKAFITLKAAQDMWQNKYGSVTAIHFQNKDVDREKITLELLKDFKPAYFGYVLQDVRNQAFTASNQAVDFGQLFLGLSFFIILAALLLTAQLFIFSVESRSRQMAILHALGFMRFKIMGVLFAEEAIVATAGAFVGAFCGILYNQVVLFALSNLWRDAVQTENLVLHVDWLTMILGMAGGIAISIVTLWLTLLKLGKTPFTELKENIKTFDIYDKPKKPWISIVLSIFCLLAGFFIIIYFSSYTGSELAGIFFAVGGLLLVSGLCLINIILFYCSKSGRQAKAGIIRMGLGNIPLRRRRSLLIVSLVACGVFVILGVGANRQDVISNTEARTSGSGGYAFWLETSIPVLKDLGSPEGRREYGLTEPEFQDVTFTQLRVKEGDDASCLNLNRVIRPRIIALDAQEFQERGAFTFDQYTEIVDRKKPWLVLNQTIGENTIPAIADSTVITWGLGLKVGDIITYEDEFGQTINLKLVAGLASSIFQGNILIGEKYFKRHFPFSNGYNILLVDIEKDRRAELAEILKRIFNNLGMEMISAGQRLRQFHVVEDTYLSIFLLLGALGLLLGSIGMGVVVLRSIEQARGQLALLRAVGFSKMRIYVLLIIEHLFLLICGMSLGAVTAMLAVLPAVLAPHTEIPFTTISGLMIFILLNGVGWIILSSIFATRGEIFSVLKKE